MTAIEILNAVGAWLILLAVLLDAILPDPYDTWSDWPTRNWWTVAPFYAGWALLAGCGLGALGAVVMRGLL